MNWRLTLENHDEDADRFARVSAALAPASFDFQSYYPSEEALEAVNTALSLGMPLLVTGEPGVGKTRLAYYIAARLGLFVQRAGAEPEPEVHRYDVKSTAEGQNLLYQYDAVRHFRAKDDLEVIDCLELTALGQGIALACSDDDLRATTSDLRRLIERDLGDHGQRERLSVVLIDEIDKAPRDVPNDLLRELDEMSFRVQELKGAELRCTSALRPFVIITSNEEKSLPDPFLRRCCFIHLEYPDADHMRNIIARQIGDGWSNAPVSEGILDLAKALRAPKSGVRKKPGTAEVLNFLFELMARGVQPEAKLAHVPNVKGLATIIFGNGPGDAARIGGLIDRIASAADDPTAIDAS